MSTALVLGAGGRVGQAWHLGVLGALEDLTGFDPRNADVLVGTSAGSLVANGLAGGLAVGDLSAQVLQRPVSAEARRVLAAVGPGLALPEPEAPPARGGPLAPEALLAAVRRPWSTRPGSVLAGLLPAGRQDTSGIVRAVRRLHPGAWPARDLRVCAVRARDARRVVFGTPGAPQVDVGLAVAASCAVPRWFAPVRIGGDAYVDGGAHSPSNADVVLRDRPDLVVVLSPMSGALPGRRADLGVRLTVQAVLGAEVLRLRRAGCRVVVLQPSAADLDVMGTDLLRGTGLPAVLAQAAGSTRERLAAEPGLLDA